MIDSMIVQGVQIRLAGLQLPDFVLDLFFLIGVTFALFKSSRGLHSLTSSCRSGTRVEIAWTHVEFWSETGRAKGTCLHLTYSSASSFVNSKSTIMSSVTMGKIGTPPGGSMVYTD